MIKSNDQQNLNTSFWWIGNCMAREVGMFGRECSPFVGLLAIPPWCLPQPVIDLGLLVRVRYVEERVDSVVSEHLRTQNYAF
jgi:hypothetical protein